MLVFDQLKKDDPQLRFLATVVFGGLLVLLAGLWWVQLVSSRHFQEKLEIQSLRSVRIPAVRGKILDRDGRPLAESRPSYSVDLYLEELSKNYQSAYTNSLAQVRRDLVQQKEQSLGRKLTPAEMKKVGVPEKVRSALQRQARYEVASNLVNDLSIRMQQPITLTEKEFTEKYERARSQPMPILTSLNSLQLARFEEQASSMAQPGIDLEVQSLRYYPYGPLAAHLLGYLQHNNEASAGEVKTNYNYLLPDFSGVTGIEGLFDQQLRGTSGERSVVINYLGYRQAENIVYPSEPGENVVLTIDLDVQKAADAALQDAHTRVREVRGAVVVLDAQNGDVIAMASSPDYDPNHHIYPVDPVTKAKEDERWNDEGLELQRNRAIYQNYHPGSTFKLITAMAALEQGVLDPNRIFHSLGYFPIPGRHPMGDTAGAGDFDFNKAMAMSSNPYFATYGTQPGVLQKIVEIGEHLHFGERTGIMPHQEAKGNFITLDRISSNWHYGDTANISIGQGELDVTPVQIAVMTAAVANGGKVFWPRLVSRIESADGTAVLETFPEGRVRDNLGVSTRTLRIIHGGMLADTQSANGTGHLLNVPGWSIAGKTGTAEVENRKGHIDKDLKDTWFVSFAPEENPRYVVVAAVEGGLSGGLTGVPIAHKVYLALQARDAALQRKGPYKPQALAVAQ